jgi:ABC-2 type transport system ATP-binding protein
VPGDVITTRQVTKRFGAVLAVDGVDLDVRAGDRYGLLGPNGSGKTTLLRMLLGLIFATSGEIEVAGEPIPRHAARVLPRIGSLIEGPASYAYLSGRANLALLDAAGPGEPSGGKRTRKARVDEALERVGLGGVDKRPVRAYSLGMRQRLGLAAALLRKPNLLILDEPTNGLDPRGIREIRDLLVELNEGGVTVLLSSHLLGEIEQLCTRVGVLDRGRMVIQDELDALRAPTDRVLLRTPDAEQAVALLDGRVDVREGDRLIVRAVDAAELNTKLVGAGLRVEEMVRERRSLEDLVMHATGPSSDRIDAPGAAAAVVTAPGARSPNGVVPDETGAGVLDPARIDPVSVDPGFVDPVSIEPEPSSTAEAES